MEESSTPVSVRFSDTDVKNADTEPVVHDYEEDMETQPEVIISTY